MDFFTFFSKSGFEGKISEINKRVGPKKVVSVFFPLKLIRFAARLFGRSEYQKSI